MSRSVSEKCKCSYGLYCVGNNKCCIVVQENVPDEERVQAMRENTYVRAYGHVRAFQGKHSVVAFKLMPLTDMNELSCHLLEVVHAHMVLSQQGAVRLLGLEYDYL